MANDAQRRIFFEVHKGLPREAPGNRDSTARALKLVGSLPAAARVLDIGCGPGMQTLHLAEMIGDGQITGIDAHPPYLKSATEQAVIAGVADRVRFQQADMRALPFEPGSFDLIWCEGAAYIMGVENALGSWRELLAPGGRIAFTDAVWLSEEIPDTLRDWWLAGYPEMGSIDDCLQRAVRSGYTLIDQFVLPQAAWWEYYYQPMEARIGKLRIEHAGEGAAMSVLDECQLEIDYYRRWPDRYGYLFVVAEADPC